jgi:hypothetical protein
LEGALETTADRKATARADPIRFLLYCAGMG